MGALEKVQETYQCFKFLDAEYTKYIVDGFREITLCREHGCYNLRHYNRKYD